MDACLDFNKEPHTDEKAVRMMFEYAVSDTIAGTFKAVDLFTQLL